MKPKPKLGIVDWGIGGIGIYKEARRQIGGLPVIYFSDTGAAPYGKMSRRELTSRLEDILAFLKSNGVTQVLFGCNAASTVIPLLEVDGLRVEGVIASAIKAVRLARPRRLALIGGRRTVLSGVYRDALG